MWLKRWQTDHFLFPPLTSSPTRLLESSYVKNYFQQPPSISNVWHDHRLPMLIPFQGEIPTLGPFKTHSMAIFLALPYPAKLLKYIWILSLLPHHYQPSLKQSNTQTRMLLSRPKSWTKQFSWLKHFPKYASKPESYLKKGKETFHVTDSHFPKFAAYRLYFLSLHTFAWPEYI